MIIQFTLASQSQALLKLVREFAEGLDCAVDVQATPHASLGVRLPEKAGADLLLHLLSYVALSSVKLGLDVGEPQCRIQFREPNASAAMTLAFSISAIDLGGAAAAEATT